MNTPELHLIRRKTHATWVPLAIWAILHLLGHSGSFGPFWIFWAILDVVGQSRGILGFWGWFFCTPPFNFASLFLWPKQHVKPTITNLVIPRFFGQIWTCWIIISLLSCVVPFGSFLGPSWETWYDIWRSKTCTIKKTGRTNRDPLLVSYFQWSVYWQIPVSANKEIDIGRYPKFHIFYFPWMASENGFWVKLHLDSISF